MWIIWLLEYMLMNSIIYKKDIKDIIIQVLTSYWDLVGRLGNMRQRFDFWWVLLKFETDVTINDYIGLLFNFFSGLQVIVLLKWAKFCKKIRLNKTWKTIGENLVKVHSTLNKYVNIDTSFLGIFLEIPKKRN